MCIKSVHGESQMVCKSPRRNIYQVLQMCEDDELYRHFKHGKEFRKHILKYMMTHRGYANLVPQRAKRHVIFFTFYCHKMMHSFTDGVHRLFNLHSIFLYSTMTVEIIIQVTANPFLKDDSSLPF